MSNIDALKILRTDIKDVDIAQLSAVSAAEPTLSASQILVVDDSSLMRMGLTRSLKNLGFENITGASNGKEALEKLRNGRFDLILLDIEMPEMTGLQVLEVLKADQMTDVPVIVISGGADAEDAIRCIEMGAEDYLPKSFNPVLLRARVTNSLHKKRLRDHDKIMLETIRQQHAIVSHEKEVSENLLLNILPREISTRLKSGEELIADAHAEVSILFADLSGFTALSRTMTASRLVEILNSIFCEFDRIMERFGVEKIKTIGDCYMVVSGLPIARVDHAPALVTVGFEMIKALDLVNATYGTNLRMRIGLNTGNVVAGVIGLRKFTYDLWGDAVNVASRMESTGAVGRVHISEFTAKLLPPEFVLEDRGTVDVKGVGQMSTFFVNAATSVA
ncbi:MAG: adenylate/guanylate cyclase domain-containing protein [Pseudomonadota bacterium]